MAFYFKLALLVSFITVFTSCKNNTAAIGNKNKTYKFTVGLPFESSNYHADSGNDTGFVLKDSMGKFCIPSTDTVTKSGGTVEYNNLPSSIYNYSIKTIFNETIKGTIHIVSDSNIALVPSVIYSVQNAITLDSLIAADSINIVLSDTILTNRISLKKISKSYLVSFQSNMKKSKPKQMIKDSASIIHALTDLEVAMLGLQSIELNESWDYWPATSFYMKTPTQFIQCSNLQIAYFNKVHQQFIKAILSK